MGMAASQARFLNLTARKTNIEYQGQQINEQRTSLSNESADLYNQMLTLQVPTPPNTQDYTKVQYTFMMPGGVDEATVAQIAPIKDKPGQYSVIFSYKTTELGMPACSDSQKSRAFGATYTTDPDNPVLTGCSITTAQGKSYALTKYTGSNGTDATDAQKLEYELHNDAITKLRTDLDDADLEIFYVNVGTEAAPKYQYYSAEELKTATAEGAKTNAVTYYYAGDIETYKEDSYTPCTINRDVYNRVQSFTHTPDGGSPTTYSVTTKTITDDDAYNDAMNEYTYLSYLYEQEMANINAKTSIVHAQDRSLELKLKQLDTEHNAVQTEIEAVKGVCKKNVEDSFKTFA